MHRHYPGLSDHFLVSVNLPLVTTAKGNQDHSCIRLFHKTDLGGFRDEIDKLHKVVAHEIDEGCDINTVWATFRDGLLHCVTKYVPVKHKRVRSPHEPMWFNLSAKQACSKQRKLYMRFIKTGDPIHKSMYKSLRKINKKLFRKLKQEYHMKTMYAPFLNGNTRPFFKHVKNLRGSTNTINSIKTLDGSKSDARDTIASTLNDYFHSVFSRKSEMPVITSDNTEPVVVTQEGVKKLLEMLKRGKAPRPDGLTGEILCLDTIGCSKILTDIFNLSLRSRRLPCEWKKANATPIFKGGERNLASNYRPVSLTCICCKLLEHIVLHTLQPQLDDVLCSNQHGFRKNLSCTTQLITVLHDLTNCVDNKTQVHAAVLDFSKAFDLVPHDNLISKLINMNFDHGIIEWVADFLSDRTQRVLLDGVASPEAQVTSGVPQGSVLGPALFLVYINDIVDAVSTSHIRLFADDTMVYREITSELDQIEFQRDLDRLYDWSVRNSMRFNAKKSKIIAFGTSKNDVAPKYDINGDYLETTESVKYLGVSINAKLRWNDHIDTIIRKGSGILGLLRHTLYDAPMQIKRVAYFTLCRPVLEYGSEAWDPYEKEQVTKLEVLQNKALRFIFNVKGRDVSMSELRQSQGIDSLEKRRKDARFRLLHSIIENDTLHPSLMATLDSM